MVKRNYDCKAYKKFRTDVLRRDKRTCRWPKCGSRKRIHVHHIRTWASHPALRFVVKNGICLCRYHHDLISGKEEYYEKLFYLILMEKRGEKSSRQQSKKKTVKRKATRFSQKYAKAKRKRRR